MREGEGGREGEGEGDRKRQRQRETGRGRGRGRARERERERTERGGGLAGHGGCRSGAEVSEASRHPRLRFGRGKGAAHGLGGTTCLTLLV